MPTLAPPLPTAAAVSAIMIFSSLALGQPLPTIGPQVRIDVGGGVDAANETTAAASDLDPNVVIAGWNDWRRSTGSELINAGFSMTFDGGASWSDFLLRPPAPNQSNVEGDPMSTFDPRTGALWGGAISFSAGSNSGIYVARLDPGETEFNPSVMVRTAGGTDKCFMAAGPRPGMPDTTRVYIAYNEGVIRSDDMGDTWTSPQSLASGIGFLPRVGPGGEVYISYWDFGTGMMLKRSLDGERATYSTHTMATRMDVWSTQSGSRFPGTFRVPSFPYIEVDENTGTLYTMYFDTTNVVGGNSNVDLYFTTSTDQGTTWTTPVVINEDAPTPGDQFFCYMEVDGFGRIHVVYMDSRNVVQNDNVVHGMFDNYYTYSCDGGSTWHETRLTPASYDSDDDGLSRTNQFMGDYLGLAVGGTKIYPVYIDTTAGDTDTFSHTILAPEPGDTNGDQVANFLDLLEIFADWGPCSTSCNGDVTCDGVVNFSDILEVFANWG